MSESAQSEWKHLWNDCVQLHSDFQEFRFLFGEKEARVELMNKTANSFFYSLQRSMWHSLLLQICRLTDPAKNLGRANLSVCSLAAHASPQDGKRVADLITKAVNASDFARPWRNRRIAHRDFEVATKAEGAQMLPEITIAHVQEALNAISAVLDACAPDGTHASWQFSPSAYGALSLLLYLREGVMSEERNRLDRMNGGMSWREQVREPI